VPGNSERLARFEWTLSEFCVTVVQEIQRELVSAYWKPRELHAVVP
jgi:hypothetical protein